MIVNRLQRRALGLPVKLDVSNVLESFESLKTDEYIGEDEGAFVPPLACEFCKVKSKGHILAVVDENGFIVIYNTKKTGQMAIVDDWQAHNNAIFDMVWVEGEGRILTASGDQTVVLWDVERQEKLDVFRGHTSSVRCVCAQQGSNAVFATGSRDGHIMIWDARCNKKDGHISPVNIIRNAHSITLRSQGHKTANRKLGPPRDSQMSVTAVLFQSDTNLFSAGTIDGCIKEWDLRRNFSISSSDALPKVTFTYPGLSKRRLGYSNLAFDSSYTQLFANCRDDVIYQYNVINYSSKPVHCYKGHESGSFFIKSCVSPDNNYLLTGSTDEMAYIYKIGCPKQSPIVLKGHGMEVSDVKWCPTDFSKIATLSDDNTMRIWRLHRRPGPADPGEVTGSAERTHKEIGVSADDLEQRLAEKADHTLISSSNNSVGNKLCSTSMVSPSIKSWLSKSLKKTKLESSEGQRSVDSTSVKNSDTGKVSIFQGNRLPCKRKLINEDSEDSGSFERFAKRQRVQDSPIKVSELRSPRKLEIKQSPRKIPPTLTGSLQKDPAGGCPQVSRSPLTPRLCPLSSSSNVADRISCGPTETISSPTVNLPNLVKEGSVNKINIFYKQSDKENSPQKLNWLSQIRQQKLETREERSKGSPKRALFEKVAESPRSRSSQSSSSQSSSQEEIRSPVPKGMKPLHAYFKRKKEV
ncbi:denticleless protein homolog [Crassostrea virginica]